MYQLSIMKLFFLICSLFGLIFATQIVSQLKILTLWMLMLVLQSKFKSYQCFGSGKTFANMSCKIKTIDRNSNALDFAIDIVSDINILYVSF